MPLLILGFMVLWLLFWVCWAVLWLFWPVAPVLLGCLLWRGQMRHWQLFAAHGGERSRASWFGRPSGNSAFDEYRADTLRTLDEERGRFQEFLDRLRRSEDKEEFDRFMAGRRPRPRLPAV
jgi:uncharacterized protein DUF2852